jgi:hypothetical protein
MSVSWRLVAGAVGFLALTSVVRKQAPHRSEEEDSRSPHLESRDEYELTHDTGSPHLESRCEWEETHPSRRIEREHSLAR